MKLQAVAMMTMGLVLATEASAADIASQAAVRPGTSVAARRVSLAKGARAAAPVDAESAVEGDALIPVAIGAGVLAGGIILATRHNDHSSSP